MTRRRKLIEVAFPLEGVGLASAREKEPFTQNHPRSLHIWWARRPLAACRAILVASLIDDPDQDGVPDSYLRQIDRLLPSDVGDASQGSLAPGEQRRQKLLSFLERLALWENRADPEILSTARELIHASTEGSHPPVLDPFCGGGSIPLEAQRLGLESYAGDLNPVAVLISRALVELPQQYSGIGPVNPVDLSLSRNKAGKEAAGLAADIRHYGEWVYQETKKRLAHLYPNVRLPIKQGRMETAPAASIWARTVRCPNPECGGWMPLVRSFWLSTRKRKKAWIEPRVTPGARVVQFDIRTGEGSPREGTINRRGATCIFCGHQVPFSYLRSEGQGGRMGRQLMAIAIKGRRNHTYLPPQYDSTPNLTEEEQQLVNRAREGYLSAPTPAHLTGGCCHGYGLTTWGSLFTPRQIIVLATFGELVQEVREHIEKDGLQAGLKPDVAVTYADVVSTYLALSISRWMDLYNTLSCWNSSNENVRALFARHAIPMTWDYVELSPFGPLARPTAFFENSSAIVAEQGLASAPGKVARQDASSLPDYHGKALVCTDPPYYDNVAYGDLSDFFYVSLRNCLGDRYPELFETATAPKKGELVAVPYRFKGGKTEAKAFFEKGLMQAFSRIREIQHPDYPFIIFYAHKQPKVRGARSKRSPATTSPGWEAMLEALIGAGFMITAGWPLRSERRARTVALRTNALSTSMVLACRLRPACSPTMTEQQFVAALRIELSEAIRRLRDQNVEPQELAQAAIGPGMAVFSRCAEVTRPDGKPLSVRDALAWISKVLEMGFFYEQ